MSHPTHDGKERETWNELYEIELDRYDFVTCETFDRQFVKDVVAKIKQANPPDANKIIEIVQLATVYRNGRLLFTGLFEKISPGDVLEFANASSTRGRYSRK